MGLKEGSPSLAQRHQPSSLPPAVEVLELHAECSIEAIRIPHYAREEVSLFEDAIEAEKRRPDKSYHEGDEPSGGRVWLREGEDERRGVRGKGLR